MNRPPLEVADIIRAHGKEFVKRYHSVLTREHRKVLRAIEHCRTAALGGHVDQCDRCGYRVISYNSCRNRHCPKCQIAAREKWLADRTEELLPVPYFHVVFTLPPMLAELALQNQRGLYGLLFQASSRTLLQIGANRKHLGAQLGFLSVLHTWGQNLQHHPHVHCIIPAGGLVLDHSRWIHSRKKFFLPVRVLSRLFRGKFLALLKRVFRRGQLTFPGELSELAQPEAFQQMLRHAYLQEWVVYAKPPFGGPRQVLKYLSRYTHRVAISNHRLIALQDGKVTFRWKNYKSGSQKGAMTLDAVEFLRRFMLHVLPRGFVRIRSFGFLANRVRKRKLQICRTLLRPEPTQLPMNAARPTSQTTSYICPSCHHGRMIVVERLTAQQFLFQLAQRGFLDTS